MMHSRALSIWIVLLASSLLLASCASQEVVSSQAAAQARSAVKLPDDGDFTSRAQHQQMLVSESRNVQRGFVKLASRGEWRERGYFDASEHDAMEALLFRMVTLRSAFWGEFDRLGGVELTGVQADAQPHANLLVLHLGLSLADSGTFLVSTFAGDDIAIAKINEPYYRAAIERGTYSRLRLGSTSRVRREQLSSAWALHMEAVADSASPLAQLIAADPEAAALASQAAALYARTLPRIAAIDERDDMPGRIQHSAVAKLAREAAGQFGDAGYASRALTFKDVSRLRSPILTLIAFSPDQKARIFDLLAPGDLILTFTGGHVSDVFIPGHFKHGITYVGSAEQRLSAGVTAQTAKAPDGAPVLARLAEYIRYDTLPDGRAADVVEAIAEGVKFSNLETILDTHINRLLVLRPRIDPAERAAFIAQVMSYIGDPYDFRFDFADASRQVCTEVIYRGLNGKGGIEFELASRGGHPTLSADDIITLHLASAGEHFEMVLYAEASPEGGKKPPARLLEGDAAEKRVAALMAPTE